jgi:hypothetical protein
MLTNRTGADTPAIRKLDAIVSRQRSLEEVVRWGLSQSPPRVVADVITQDEFTHDVILPTGDGLYLVYDTT